MQLRWNRDLAYVVGLIATDGNLSPDGRHINVTSKDKEIVLACKEILGLSNRIGRKGRERSTEKNYYVLQFGSKNFYEFLLAIGITPAKSKTLGRVHIPERYFADFLRGCVDGDGNINEFFHPESAQLQLRVGLTSASPAFLEWIRKQIRKILRTKGGWLSKDSKKSVLTLRFGKEDSVKILRGLYHRDARYFLKRKHKTATTYI